MTRPAVSVVMPVHNAAPFLDESLRSIVRQSFADFEFVIRDDGSTDGSRQILRAWAGTDSRIRLFEGSRLGPSGSSNWIVDAASAPIVARMDADDIAYPDRLGRQLEVLRSSPDLVLLGTMFDMVDRHGRTLRPYDFSRLVRSGYSAPFPHASIMFRRDIFRQAGGYRAGCEHWEDLDLYLRIAEFGPIAVLAEPLLAYRAHASTRLVSHRDTVERCLNRRYRCVELHRKGSSYDPLVSKPVSFDDDEKCHPRTFIALGSMELWSNRTPHMLRRMLKRGELHWNLESSLAIIWAVWAGASPRSLRWFLTMLVRLKNLALRNRVVRGQIYEWNPRREAANVLPASSAASCSVRPVRPVGVG